MTTKQQVTAWADAHHITSYDMDAVLAQVGENATEDSIYHAVIDHEYKSVGDREGFAAYLQLFGITDSDVAEKVIDAASFEHDGELVYTPSTLDAALNEHWYK